MLVAKKNDTDQTAALSGGRLTEQCVNQSAAQSTLHPATRASALSATQLARHLSTHLATQFDALAVSKPNSNTAPPNEPSIMRSAAYSSTAITAKLDKDPIPEAELFGSFFLGDDEFALQANCIYEVVNSPKKLSQFHCLGNF